MAKEEKKKTEPAEKKMVQNILTKYPTGARHLFKNENGTRVVEDRVPRGDPEIGSVGNPHCGGDLTAEDLTGIAKYAVEIIDEGILRYDEKIAYEDALHRAIDSKDGGKYAGKINAPTYNLILSSMGKKKAAPTEKKAAEQSQTQSTDTTDITIDSSNDSKEDQMGNLGELAKVAQFIAGQTPEQRLILKAMIKEAADQNDPKRWQKTLDSIGIKAPKSKSASEEDETPGEDEAMNAEKAKKDKDAAEGDKGHEEGESKAEKKKEEKAVEEATGKPHDEDEPGHKDTPEEKKIEEKVDGKDATTVLGELDSIAGELEASGDYDLFKIAYQLDQVAEVLEGKKTAASLESEPDEKYMKDAFNSIIHQKEKDEKYMESFATDKTQEVNKAYAKRPYGIVK